MPYTAAGKNQMLDALGVTHVAAFEGDPTGAGVELDRKAITHGAAAAGERTATTDPVFDIEAGETVNHMGYFNDPAAGDLLGYDPVTPEGPYGSAGTYTLTDSTLDLNS